MKLLGYVLLTIATVFLLLSPSCKSDPVEDSGGLRLNFEHKINCDNIRFDEMIYANAAGNQYMVNEIQYFISDITITNENGSEVLLDEWEDIHYIDTDIESTKTYELKDEIEPGVYRQMSFTFGINEEKNQSQMFVNPPESLMFWPELLGGGYHYMKLNGKWLDTLNQVSPFNFHLGIGQIYHSFPDSISGYVHNHFKVVIPNTSFRIEAGQTTEIKIVMNVENWFDNPNVFDHNEWGGHIMQKQEAMKAACENGWNVFSIE